MSSKYDYDLFTIGAGSGGVRASRMAARYGAKVAVAEERYYGGTCVNVGCVPKKLFSYASHFHEEFRDAAGFGWTVGDSTFDWGTLIANKNNEIERLNGIYERMLGNAGVEIIDGRATIVDPHTVSIQGRTISAERILVATGGWPWMPDNIPGIEHAISSNEAFYLEKFPERVLVAGGGYIAVEFAGIFNGLGAQTTQVYRSTPFLRGFDHDLREGLAEEMRKKGVDLHFNTRVHDIEKRGEEYHVTINDGAQVTVDTVMFATGRRPMSANMGLEEVGVKLDPIGSVVVDDNFQTSVSSIYALGDVTNRLNLTPVALAEGMALAKSLFNDEPTQPDYTNVATAVFSQPNLATVGLTEEHARVVYDEVDIYRETFRALKHTLSGSSEQTLMKLVVEPTTDRVLGVHMMGPDAGEVIQGFAVALKAGATKAVFDSTVGIHPTAAEEFVTMREKVQS
ncbi:MAG: glutathione-disulfide reductase [Chloroflexota bacterium]